MVDHYFDIETSGLNPFKHNILTIQLKRKKDIFLWTIWEEKNELKVLLNFLKYLRTVSTNNSIYGYNILKFDIPFIATKLNIHALMNEENYKLLYEKKWIDLYQYLGDNYVPLEHWIRKLGIKRVCPFQGKDIPNLYLNKKFREIENHAKDDLIITEKLAIETRNMRMI